MNRSSESTSSNSNKDEYLRHLNKISHKISKQPVINKSISDPSIHNPNRSFPQFRHPQPPPPPSNAENKHHHQPPPSHAENQQQHQPPVYNINKSDFREVVQKLTGSPAHERLNKPPPIQQPKPPSSRLHRIRPPPLAHLSNRPPSLLNSTASVSIDNNANIQRQVAPLSPLPPFPTVHAAGESPISAYMRYIHSTISTVDLDQRRFSGLSSLAPLASPRWSHPVPAPVLQGTTTASQTQFTMPLSPIPFGCLRSPGSPYSLISPTAGQLGFPHFPSVPGEP